MATANALLTTPADDEISLPAYLDSLTPTGFRAVHLALSLLKPQARRKAKMRQAAAALEAPLKGAEGRLFSLDNSDLVLVVKGAVPGSIDAAVGKAAAPFAADSAGIRLAHVYDLAAEHATVRELAATLHDAQATPGTKSKTPRAAGPAPIHPDQLAAVEAKLAEADLTPLMRRQTVCMLVPNEKPKPVFRELYVSIPDLEAAVAPGVKLAADRWLFQHLTRTLDARMLTLLTRSRDRSLGSHVSLNLNVASVLSPEFLAFDKGLRPEARGTIVIELQLVDILADMGAFMFARDFARERGYSLCLDGLTYLTAPLVDRTLLGLDLVKVIWSQDMIADEGEARRNAFAWMIDKTGDGRAILCRCDNEEAIGFGQQVGIALFQGIAVDTRAEAGLAATATPGTED